MNDNLPSRYNGIKNIYENELKHFPIRVNGSMEVNIVNAEKILEAIERTHLPNIEEVYQYSSGKVQKDARVLMQQMLIKQEKLRNLIAQSKPKVYEECEMQ